MPLTVVSWDGGGDGSRWSDPANWSPDGVPVEGDDILIDMAGSYDVVLWFNTPAFASFTMDAPDATFVMQSGTLNVVGPSLVSQGSVDWGGSRWNSTTLTNNAEITVYSGRPTFEATEFHQNGELRISAFRANVGGFVTELCWTDTMTNRGRIVLVGDRPSSLGCHQSRLVNLGTIEASPIGSSPESSGTDQRNFLGEIVNEGVIDIDHDSYLTSGRTTTLTNRGSVNVRAPFGAQGGGTEVFHQDSGTLRIEGLTFSMDGGSSGGGQDAFHYNGGSIIGTPILKNINNIIISPEATNRATLILRSRAYLHGPVPENITLRLQGVDLRPTEPEFVNHGTVLFEGVDGWGSGIIAQSLINEGSIETTDLGVCNSNFCRAHLLFAPNGELVNSATINVLADTKISGRTITNHGLIHIDSIATATLEQGPFVNANDGMVTGSGSLHFLSNAYGIGSIDANIIVDDSMSPGQIGIPGVINVGGDYDLSSGILGIEIGGTTPGATYDQLNIGGNLDLGRNFGWITVTIIDGFVPNPCDQFHVVTYASRTGDLPAGIRLAIVGEMSVRPVLTDSGLTLVAYEHRSPINIRPTSMVVGEGGPDNNYDVCLGTAIAPKNDVTVTATIQPHDQITGDPVPIVFDASSDDWKDVKTVTVAAIDDSDLEGNHAATISHTSQSADPKFNLENAFEIENVFVDIRDNDIPLDRFEENDRFASAADIGSADAFLDELTVHQYANEDWYRWTTNARGDFAVDLFFDHLIGNLELQVYDASNELIAWSSTITDDEHVSVPVLNGETMYIRVFGFDGATHLGYQLSTHLNPSQDQIYITRDQQVLFLDLEGNQLGVIEDPLFNQGRLGDVEVGPNGLVYVAVDGDAGTGRNGSILEFTPRGKRGRVFPLPDDCPTELCSTTTQYPAGFDVLNDGSLLVGQPDSDLIWQVFAHRPPIAIEPEDPNRQIHSPLDTIIASDGQVVWSDSENRGQGFVNPSRSGHYWITVPNQHQTLLFDPSGTQIDDRQSPANAFPIDAMELSDRSLLVLNRVEKPGNLHESLLQQFDIQGNLVSSIEMIGTPHGLAIVNAELPSRMPGLDRDGDGLLDVWETEGYDVNHDGIIDIDLPAMGANKDRKDLFVEVDAMSGRAPLPLVQPIASVDAAGLSTGTVLDRVVESFLNAPVDNPDGTTGIQLHLQLDEMEVRLQPFNTKWNEFSRIKNGQGREGRSGKFGSLQQRQDHNWPNIRTAKRATFRYAMFADQFGATKLSGNAELPGNDFMITLGGWDTVGGTADQQAGTFMHELGHTLGLKHGGGDDINFKPNYASVMNYSWQNPHPENTGWELDFSRVELATLDEGRLNEVAGVGAPQNRSLLVGPLPFHLVMLNGSVDWNQDEVISAEEPVSADINRGFLDSNGDGFVNELDESPGQLLHGHDDWTNLRFVFTDLQSFLEFRDGDKDKPELPDRDPSRLYLVEDDGFEPNNSIDDSIPLDGTDVEVPGATIAPGETDDVDWYEWISMYTGELIAVLEILTGGVQFDVSMHDSAGNQIETAEETVETEEGTTQIRLQKSVTAGEKLHFRISGEGFTGFYNLSIDGPERLGDVDGNQAIDDRDIDLLCAAIEEHRTDRRFDLNSDDVIDMQDFSHLVRNILGTNAGDANLDGRFNSNDLIAIFVAGEYQDQLADNSIWSTGDWNCDREFDTGDLIAGFQAGTYTSSATIRDAMGMDDARFILPTPIAEETWNRTNAKDVKESADRISPTFWEQPNRNRRLIFLEWTASKSDLLREGTEGLEEPESPTRWLRTSL